MLGITRSDRYRSTWIRAKTRVKDIVQVVKKIKWRWAKHIARMKDNRWTKRITDCFLYNVKKLKETRH